MSIISVVRELAAWLVGGCVGVAIAPCSLLHRTTKKGTQTSIYFSIFSDRRK
jgi:hypothetical protein